MISALRLNHAPLGGCAKTIVCQNLTHTLFVYCEPIVAWTITIVVSPSPPFVRALPNRKGKAAEGGDALSAAVLAEWRFVHNHAAMLSRGLS